MKKHQHDDMAGAIGLDRANPLTAPRGGIVGSPLDLNALRSSDSLTKSVIARSPRRDQFQPQQFRGNILGYLPGHAERRVNRLGNGALTHI